MRKEKMPRVSVYITPKELKEIIERTNSINQIAGENEKSLVIKVEGTINYHDLQKIKKLNI